MTAAGVQFLTARRTEPYGRFAVFLDIAGAATQMASKAVPVARNPASSRAWVLASLRS